MKEDDSDSLPYFSLFTHYLILFLFFNEIECIPQLHWHYGSYNNSWVKKVQYLQNILLFYLMLDIVFLFMVLDAVCKSAH